MKLNKSAILAFVLLVLVGSLYRVMPRPFGFAPQIAMTIFGALMIKDRKWAIALPVLSMFISDCIYQLLYVQGISNIKGFYGGMWQNYLLIAALTFIPFFFRKPGIKNAAVLSFVSPTVYFLVSNFLVWAGNGGYRHPKTFGGLMQTYVDGLPFYGNSILATIVFSALFFGGYYLLKRIFLKPALA
jgi:hypothetical protein